jgi:hypothetical protein
MHIPLKFLASCVIGTVLLSGAALADESTPRVDTRQDNQKERIQQGVKSGELTRREAKTLIQGQRKVNRIEKNAAADGKITAKERLRLEHAQDRQSEKIFVRKHNKRDRN